MKLIYFSILLLLTNSLSLKAQTNYVANTPNSNGPANYNTLVGSGAGNGAMSGSANAFFGYQAGLSNTTGFYNTFVGNEAGATSTVGANNAFVGHQAGLYNRGGSTNLFAGVRAGYNNTNGNSNVFIGYQSGFNNVASNNTFIGASTGGSNTSGTQNTFLGFQAGSSNTTAGANTFLGYQAGYSNMSGAANVFVGSAAGYANTTGTGNMFLGQQAGFNNSSGDYNLFVGNSSGSATTTGVGNTAIGDGSLLRNSVGTHNVAIGQYAGVENRSDENTFIGFAADVSPNTPNLTNATAIGARARVSQSNSIVLGANANVGIGTGAPSARLHVTAGAANTSGLRLENLTSSSPASATSQYKFLTVDGSGNVILASLNGSAREGAVDVLWQRKGTLLQSLNGESVVIGSKVDKTPSGYKLFVEDGILTEKVKVAVKNTSEWSDYVFKSGYALPPLTEVEQYIQKHEHLPGVPSAKEMVEQGNDLHKTDAKLLEKIEELTLYSIQLEKSDREQKLINQKQQAKIDELEQLVNKLLQKK